MNLIDRLTIAVVKARVQQKERKIPAEVARARGKTCSALLTASLELAIKFDFSPKLHDTKFNFHFIIFLLKS
jgi:hypothetical protein